MKLPPETKLTETDFVFATFIHIFPKMRYLPDKLFV